MASRPSRWHFGCESKRETPRSSSRQPRSGPQHIDLAPLGLYVQFVPAQTGRASQMQLRASRAFRAGERVLTESTDITGDRVECARRLLPAPWAALLQPRSDAPIMFTCKLLRATAAKLSEVVSTGHGEFVNADKVLRYVHKVQVNAFTASTMNAGYSDAQRVAVFAIAGFADHACVPNTVRDVAFRPGVAVFECSALRDIDVDEPITIAYFPGAHIRPVRFAALEFVCRCPSCTSEREEAPQLLETKRGTDSESPENREIGRGYQTECTRPYPDVEHVFKAWWNAQGSRSILLSILDELATPRSDLFVRLACHMARVGRCMWLDALPLDDTSRLAEYAVASRYATEDSPPPSPLSLAPSISAATHTPTSPEDSGLAVTTATVTATLGGNAPSLRTRVCGRPGCSVSRDDLARCASCADEYYCGKTCQREHWSTHRSRCTQARALRVSNFERCRRTALEMSLHAGEALYLAVGRNHVPSRQFKESRTMLLRWRYESDFGSKSLDSVELLRLMAMACSSLVTGSDGPREMRCAWVPAPESVLDDGRLRIECATYHSQAGKLVSYPGIIERPKSKTLRRIPSQPQTPFRIPVSVPDSKIQPATAKATRDSVLSAILTPPSTQTANPTPFTTATQTPVQK